MRRRVIRKRYIRRYIPYPIREFVSVFMSMVLSLLIYVPFAWVASIIPEANITIDNYNISNRLFINIIGIGAFVISFIISYDAISHKLGIKTRL